MADESRRFYAVQFHPEVTHTKQGTAILARFAHEICGCGRDWNMHDYVRRGGGRHPRAGRRRRGAARAVRRRRLVGGGGTDPPRDRRSADLRVRRSRAAASQRGRAGDAHVRAEPRRARDPRRCQRGFPGRARRRRRSGGKAQDHRPPVRRGVPARGGEAAQREVAGAGHDLSGRDRIGGCHDQEGAHDQVASQCRRPARDAAPEAARAVARALQGRGARARPRARPAARDGVPASVSRARASACASWAR